MEPIIINGELYHHGILGQRWGVQNGPPYPLKGGMHTDLEMGRAKKKVGTLSGYFKDKKLKKQRAAALEKARATRAANIKRAEEEKTRAEQKEKVLSSGSASDLMQYKGELSADEIRRAIDRIDMERKLASYSQQEIKTTADKFEDVMKKVDRAADWAQRGIKFYNVVSKVVNAYNEEDVLPPILDPTSKWDYKTKKEKYKQELLDTLRKQEEVSQQKTKSLKDKLDIVSQHQKNKRENEKADEEIKQAKETTKAMKETPRSWDWEAYSANYGKKSNNGGDNNGNNGNGNNGNGKKEKDKNKKQNNNQNNNQKKVETSKDGQKKITQKEKDKQKKSEDEKKQKLEKEKADEVDTLAKMYSDMRSYRSVQNDINSKIDNSNTRWKNIMRNATKAQLNNDVEKYTKKQLKKNKKKLGL